MNNYDFEMMREQLRLDLKPSRYEHTMGVAYTAAALAMRYNIDMEKAYCAGLLHDCAKYLSDEQSIELLQYTDLKPTEVELANPALLHAKCGVVLAKEKFGITDDKILHAIMVHTTGCPSMSPLDKIIYIADYIEPNRDHVPNLKDVRMLAFGRLDDCLLQILKDTVKYLESTGKVVDPKTRQTFEFYSKAAAGI